MPRNGGRSASSAVANGLRRVRARSTITSDNTLGSGRSPRPGTGGPLRAQVSRSKRPPDGSVARRQSRNVVGALSKVSERCERSPWLGTESRPIINAAATPNSTDPSSNAGSQAWVLSNGIGSSEALSRNVADREAARSARAASTRSARSLLGVGLEPAAKSARLSRFRADRTQAGVRSSPTRFKCCTHRSSSAVSRTVGWSSMR